MPYKNKEDRIERDREYYRKHAEEIKQRERERYWNNRATIRKRRKELSTPERKAKAAERERLRYASYFKWLRDNNFPDEYRILCMNCNFSLGRFGYCPHKHRG